MKMIDTHSHLYTEEFDDDRDEAVARAREAGVSRLIFPAIDSESHDRLFAAARRYAGYCAVMMGLHPTSVNDNPRWREELEIVERTLTQAPLEGIDRFVAVGEIGLDFYWSRDFVAEQTEAFVFQLRLAARLGLPVAIHTRDAWGEMVEILTQESRAARERGEELRGVLHAYSDSIETYRALREVGHFKFGIGGVVTFKKSPLAEVVREMELEDLLLETDCPYLTPAPFRGKRNESGYISYICHKIAELKGVEAKEVARITTKNADTLFGLGMEH